MKAFIKYSPHEILTKMVNAAFISVKLPKSNNARSQQQLSDLYIANAMASLGTAKKKAITDEMKLLHTEKLDKLAVKDTTELEAVAPFKLLAKKTSPRSQFDKDAFIKKVAEEYEISMSELVALSKKTVKTTAAPISFEVILSSEEQPF